MEKQRRCLKRLGEEINNSPGSKNRKPNERVEEGTKKLPFAITEEFQILKDVRDITEEIHMLLHVVEQQKEALRMLYHHYSGHSAGEGTESVTYPGVSVDASNSGLGRTKGSAENKSEPSKISKAKESATVSKGENGDRE